MLPEMIFIFIFSGVAWNHLHLAGGRTWPGTVWKPFDVGPKGAGTADSGVDLWRGERLDSAKRHGGRECAARHGRT